MTSPPPVAMAHKGRVFQRARSRPTGCWPASIRSLNLQKRGEPPIPRSPGRARQRRARLPRRQRHRHADEPRGASGCSRRRTSTASHSLARIDARLPALLEALADGEPYADQREKRGRDAAAGAVRHRVRAARRAAQAGLVPEHPRRARAARDRLLAEADQGADARDHELGDADHLADQADPRPAGRREDRRAACRPRERRATRSGARPCLDPLAQQRAAEVRPGVQRADQPARARASRTSTSPSCSTACTH